jgi:hypothetical protein
LKAGSLVPAPPLLGRADYSYPRRLDLERKRDDEQRPGAGRTLDPDRPAECLDAIVQADEPRALAGIRSTDAVAALATASDATKYAAASIGSASRLEIISPAGFERFFQELSDIGGALKADPEKLAELNARYGQEMQPETVPELLERFGLRIGEPLSGGWTP